MDVDGRKSSILRIPHSQGAAFHLAGAPNRKPGKTGGNLKIGLAFAGKAPNMFPASKMLFSCGSPWIRLAIAAAELSPNWLSPLS